MKLDRYEYQTIYKFDQEEVQYLNMSDDFRSIGLVITDPFSAQEFRLPNDKKHLVIQKSLIEVVAKLEFILQ